MRRGRTVNLKTGEVWEGDTCLNPVGGSIELPTDYYCTGCGILIGYCDCPVSGHLNKHVSNDLTDQQGTEGGGELR